MSEPIHWLAFDTEVARDIMPPDPTREERDAAFEAMRRGEAGLSVAVTWDSISDQYEVYDADTVHELADVIESFPVVAAYNNGFDLGLVSGLVGRQIRPQFIADPLQWLQDVEGRQRGTKLRQIADWTLGLTKDGDGEAAPKLFSGGQIAKLVRYTRRDVFLLRGLVRHARDHGFFHGPKGRVDLVLPDWVKDLAP